MFSYLHDRTHVKNFWMERNPILKTWFRRSRQLRDIHHRMLNDGGLMDKNFGIGFFLFDRFRSFLWRPLFSQGLMVKAVAGSPLRASLPDFQSSPFEPYTGSYTAVRLMGSSNERPRGLN